MSPPGRPKGERLSARREGSLISLRGRRRGAPSASQRTASHAGPAAVIVDTNVVVAGLLTANESAPVARILDGMLGAAFPFVLSEALPTEYRTVLVRPSLRRLHGLTVAAIESIMTDLAQHAAVLVPTAGPPAPDPGDQLLWDLLATRADLLLVTGDKRLLRDASMKGRIIAPQSFIAGT